MCHDSFMISMCHNSFNVPWLIQCAMTHSWYRCVLTHSMCHDSFNVPWLIHDIDVSWLIHDTFMCDALLYIVSFIGLFAKETYNYYDMAWLSNDTFMCDALLYIQALIGGHHDCVEFLMDMCHDSLMKRSCVTHCCIYKHSCVTTASALNYWWICVMTHE